MGDKSLAVENDNTSLVHPGAVAHLVYQVALAGVKAWCCLVHLRANIGRERHLRAPEGKSMLARAISFVPSEVRTPRW